MYFNLILGTLRFDYMKFCAELCVVKTKEWNSYSY
jgi:hypothetical protein